MKTILLEGNQAELMELPIPDPGAAEVVLAVDACGLCGSDLLKFDSGKKGGILGHEVSGRIISKGTRTSDEWSVGDRVVVAHHVPCLECHYCRRGSPSSCTQFKETNLDPGGFSDFIRVSEKHVHSTLLKIPSGLDSLSACLTEPLSCCLRNIKRLGAAPGDTVGIIGMGSIGLLMAQAFSHRGLSVLGFDTDASRVREAIDLGIEASDGAEAPKRIAELTAGRGLDFLTFTAGNTALIPEKTGWLRNGGTVNIFAELCQRNFATLDFKELYHRELSIITSYSSAPEDMREALGLIAAGAVSVAPLITQTFTFDHFDDAVRRVRSREILKAILVPTPAPIPVERRAAAVATLF